MSIDLFMDCPPLEEEARVTARRAYENNPRLTSQVMGRAIGRSRRTVDGYIADLRATQQLDIDIKAYRMNRVGIPQERIAARLGIIQRTVSRHLDYLAALPNSLNADLKKGFSITQVAEKHGWPEALVWSIALEGMDDLERFKALMWGL